MSCPQSSSFGGLSTVAQTNSLKSKCAHVTTLLKIFQWPRGCCLSFWVICSSLLCHLWPFSLHTLTLSMWIFSHFLEHVILSFASESTHLTCNTPNAVSQMLPVVSETGAGAFLSSLRRLLLPFHSTYLILGYLSDSDRLRTPWGHKLWLTFQLLSPLGLALCLAHCRHSIFC